MKATEFYVHREKKGFLSEDGILTNYYHNGMIESFGPFKDEKMEGMWRFFRENGSLLSTGNFLHSRKVGRWITYTIEGEILSDECIST